MTTSTRRSDPRSGDSLLAEQEGIHLEVKAGKIAQGAVWQRSIGNFPEHLAGFSENGIFHGIATCTNK